MSATGQRRRARAAWPIAQYRLGDTPGDDLSATTSAADRLAMMWPLAVEAWAWARRPMPTYRRGEWPGCLVRRVPYKDLLDLKLLGAAGADVDPL